MVAITNIVPASFLESWGRPGCTCDACVAIGPPPWQPTALATQVGPFERFSDAFRNRDTGPSPSTDRAEVGATLPRATVTG